jgi:hypothetical protein
MNNSDLVGQLPASRSSCRDMKPVGFSTLLAGQKEHIAVSSSSKYSFDIMGFTNTSKMVHQPMQGVAVHYMLENTKSYMPGHE